MSMAHLYRTLRMCALQRRRGSGVLVRSSLFKPGFAAPNVLSNWGLHEKYHSKQTFDWSRVGADGIGHRRRGDLPERSKRKRAGRGGSGSPGGAGGLRLGGGAPGVGGRGGGARAGVAAVAPAALPVSVSVVLPRETVPWDEFSGRLEAV